MTSPEWFDLDGWLAGLQELPIVLQLRSVNLDPGLHEPLLRFGQTAAETFDRVYRENSRLALVISMEMGAMMMPAGFDEHPERRGYNPRTVAPTIPLTVVR